PEDYALNRNLAQKRHPGVRGAAASSRRNGPKGLHTPSPRLTRLWRDYLGSPAPPFLSSPEGGTYRRGVGGSDSLSAGLQRYLRLREEHRRRNLTARHSCPSGLFGNRRNTIAPAEDGEKHEDLGED